MLSIRRAPRVIPSHAATSQSTRLPRVTHRVMQARSFASAFPIIVDPHAIALGFKDKVDVRKWSLEAPLEPEEKKQIAGEIINHNPSRSLSDLFTKKHWSIDVFNKQNLPTVLCELTDKKGFSDRVGSNYHLFMDMPIKLVGKGWKIPAELEHYREAIERSARFERMINPNYNDYNVYLTIDQRPVEPGQSQRRTGWHADSYVNVETRVEAVEKKPLIETDSIYLASDCIPTEFCAGPFPFESLDPNDTEKVLQHFETRAKSQDVVTHRPFTLVRMGPECVHQVGLNKLGRKVNRTFLKITFSRQILNREGNGINYLFDVNWPMFPRRADKRNHSNVISGYFPNAELYRMVNPAEIEKLFEKNGLFATRTSPVQGYMATPGELLQTETNGFATTVNIAKPGDWKIISKTGSKYFLSTETLEEYYEPIEEGLFSPKRTRLAFIELKEWIKILAPWGSLQYLREGDVVVKRGGEVYGVLKDDFKVNYSRF